MSTLSWRNIIGGNAITDLDLEENRECREKNLLSAVLTRAIHDYSTGQISGTALSELQGWFEEKDVYLSSGVEGGFSFPYVCEQLDLDPNVLRKLVFSRAQRGQPVRLAA